MDSPFRNLYPSHPQHLTQQHLHPELRSPHHFPPQFYQQKLSAHPRLQHQQLSLRHLFEQTESYQNQPPPHFHQEQPPPSLHQDQIPPQLQQQQHQHPPPQFYQQEPFPHHQEIPSHFHQQQQLSSPPLPPSPPHPLQPYWRPVSPVQWKRDTLPDPSRTRVYGRPLVSRTGASQCRDETYCDNIESYECYHSNIVEECCLTCKDNEVNITGCRYGDRIHQCDHYHGSNCYDKQFEDDCCETCFGLETNVTGCRFGDRVPGCQSQQCWGYDDQKRLNCCLTCVPSPFPTYPQTNSTQKPWSPPPANKSYTTPLTSSMTSHFNSSTVFTNYDTTVSDISTSTDLPTWVVPVAGCAGGLLFLVFLLILYICIRRRYHGGDHLSPIDEKMYNEYKLSKRPPVAAPRPSIDSRTPLHRQDSTGTYAYIDPQKIESRPNSRQFTNTNRRRGESDPLPPIPDESRSSTAPDTDKYGYFQPVADSDDAVFTISGKPSKPSCSGERQQQQQQEQQHQQQNTNNMSNTSPRRQNTYQTYPPAPDQNRIGPKYANMNGKI